MSLINPLKLNIAEKLESDKEYRELFFRGQAQDMVAMNIRSLRKKRKLRQSDLAVQSKTKQPAISRIEQADYSKWSFSTLCNIADVLDARIKIIIEPAEDVIKEYKKMESTTYEEADQYVLLDAAQVNSGNLIVIPSTSKSENFFSNDNIYASRSI